MAKIQLPPKKEAQPAPGKQARTVNEKKVLDVINKGGSVTKRTTPEADVVKNFNIKLLQSTLDTINELREKRPKPVGQKSPGISINGWILEAISEKAEREKRK